jgi:hypothetical protein
MLYPAGRPLSRLGPWQSLERGAGPTRVAMAPDLLLHELGEKSADGPPVTARGPSCSRRRSSPASRSAADMLGLSFFDRPSTPGNIGNADPLPVAFVGDPV